MKCFLLFLPALFLAAVPSAMADDPPGGVFALYSDVCYNRESTDLTGARIGLLTMLEATYLLYQETRGIDVTSPRIFKLSKGALVDSKLKLRIDKDVTLQATVTDTVIEGLFYYRGKSSEMPFHLRRMTAPEKSFPTC